MMANHKNGAALPTVGSLCTGYGGLDMGTIAAFGGGQLAWFAETDPHMATVLQQRIPSVPNLGDITAVDWSDLPRVNVLTAGFPCQDISAAGKRAGIRKGNRSGLFYRIMDAVRVLRPDYVVLENVAALRWKDGGLGDVLAHLAEAGYDAFWTSIRASDIGAPHRRERIFILAHPHQRLPNDHAPTAAHKPERNTSLSGIGTAGLSDPRRFRRHTHGMRPAPAEDSRSANQHPVPATPGTPSPHLTLVTDTDGLGRDERLSQRQGLERQPRPHRSGDRIPAHTAGGRQSQEPPGNRPASLRAGTGTGHRNGPRHDAGRTGDMVGSPGLLDWGVYEAAIRRWETILGRPAPPPTERGRTGRPRLSPLFVEWMMGLSVGKSIINDCISAGKRGLYVRDVCRGPARRLGVCR
ncbi:DNA cytosine methyltransferase [Allosaccharopolyspora coralli]|uniref:DNA cytosine methyltransferase n=1 Tax=Allosaccharopolyspora coralli TaxID=2665642 RepID=UPI001C9E2DDF|nr:DNA cytosine methyltransferase [Allosaccharopolyspora coralli]